MSGAILYFAVGFAFLVLSTLFSDAFTSAELVLLAFVVAIGLAVGVRNLWAVSLAGRSVSNSPVYEEWIEMRNWTGVALVAILIAGILVGLTVLRWGWEFGWYLPEANLFALGTLGLGLVLRVLVRYAVTREDGSTSLPGADSGFAGFFVLLVGLLAVLVWGDVPVEVLVWAIVGIGGYVLIYLYVATGLD